MKFIYHFFKRFFDIICSLLGILVTLIFWIIAFIGIEISDPGPVFYMSRRVGRNNREFRMFKFRTMRVAKDANENGFKADTDRIFPFGKFIRTAKIDELPQLLNILLGSMSIVGPRPASVDQVVMVRSGENEIASTVTSGLTGPSIENPFPAVCIRASTERPEALDKGNFIIAGITPSRYYSS